MVATIDFAGIRLRPMTEQDQPLVLEWRSNAELSRFMYTDLTSPNLANQLEWFRAVSRRNDSEYWVIEYEGQAVGVANLSQKQPEHRRTDWAFYLGSPSARGKGIGSKVEISIIHYVFFHLKLQKLACQVLSNNQPVIDLHMKFGFQTEGILKKHYLKNGVWCDVHLLCLFAEEAKKRGYDREAVTVRGI